jgi:hypothetical protein
VWGTGLYSAARFYSFLFDGLPKDVTLEGIWRSKCLPKLKVFAWLLIMDKLNTRDMILRRHWRLESGPSCVLCEDNHLETRDHLFLYCPFAHASWSFLGIVWNQYCGIRQNIEAIGHHFTGSCFLETFVCAAWNI